MFYSIGRAIASLDGRNFLAEFEDVADRIQRLLLDIEIPQAVGLDIGVRAAPARVVGGDYVDVIPCAGRGPLFAIGDVSGKSLPAALRAMTLKYLVRGLVTVLGTDVASTVARANEVVCVDIEPEAFVTLCVATLSSDNRTLCFANAGHDPPLVYRARQGEVEELNHGSLVMGYDPTTPYHEQTASVLPGDIIALYTDGFTEAQSPQGEQFTLAHVKEGLLELNHLSAQPLANALFDRVEAFAAGTLNDDATILIIRIVE